jgi:periplasmic copper chaperone A
MTLAMITKAVSAAALLMGASSAFSHITLADASAPAGSTYRATLRVGHGCGVSPTTAIKVILPDGFKGAKPMPKSGWTLAIVKTKLAQPYDNHGTPVTEDVSEISWTASAPEFWLPDAHYDEFVFRGGLPAQAGALWFKVIQSCEKGRTDWTEIPVSGTQTKGLESPAALLNVVEAAPAAHQH